MNIEKIISLSRKPKIFKRSETAFWDDPHISKKMLEAHLNPDWDAASRKHSTIDTSVKWMSEDIFLDKTLRILDLGCGPGLYTSRLARLGYSITGIDYSHRSIDYAKDYAEDNSLDINYIYQNYLTIDFKSEFDVIILIYCDLGALTNKERDTLLQKIHCALKPGGIFIFDVFTDKYRTEKDLGRSWEVTNDGFWNDKSYLALTESFLYPEEDTYLNQTIVITEEEEISVYRLFNHFYTVPTITNVIEKYGFIDHSFYSDIKGNRYNDKSGILAVVTRKQ